MPEEPSFENSLGSSTPADRNLIGGGDGFTGHGISFYGAPNPFSPPTKQTLIQGNYIGTDRTGTLDLGGASAIAINVSAPMVTIGGTMPGEANIVAHYYYAFDVSSARAKGVYILGNSVFDNVASGFRFAKAGPVTLSAGAAGSTTVTGIVTGTAGIGQRVEIFSNPDCGPKSIGQGKTFVGFAKVTPDASGSASFAAAVSPPLVAGEYLTATASPDDPDGQTVDYSQCFPVSAAAPLPALSIMRLSSQIRVSWTTSENGLRLQYATGLAGPWQPNPTQGTPVGGHWEMTEDMQPPARFFRIVR